MSQIEYDRRSWLRCMLYGPVVMSGLRRLLNGPRSSPVSSMIQAKPALRNQGDAPSASELYRSPLRLEASCTDCSGRLVQIQRGVQNVLATCTLVQNRPRVVQLGLGMAGSGARFA